MTNPDYIQEIPNLAISLIDGSEDNTIPVVISNKSGFEGDPKKMTTVQVEDLARNIFSVTPELNEMRNAYQILFTIARSGEEKINY